MPNVSCTYLTHVSISAEQKAGEYDSPLIYNFGSTQNPCFDDFILTGPEMLTNIDNNIDLKCTFSDAKFSSAIKKLNSSYNVCFISFKLQSLSSNTVIFPTKPVFTDFHGNKIRVMSGMTIKFLPLITISTVITSLGETCIDVNLTNGIILNIQNHSMPSLHRTIPQYNWVDPIQRRFISFIEYKCKQFKIGLCELKRCLVGRIQCV